MKWLRGKRGNGSRKRESERKKKSQPCWNDVGTSRRTHSAHFLIICHLLLGVTWQNSAKGFLWRDRSAGHKMNSFCFWEASWLNIGNILREPKEWRQNKSESAVPSHLSISYFSGNANKRLLFSSTSELFFVSHGKSILQLSSGSAKKHTFPFERPSESSVSAVLG